METVQFDLKKLKLLKAAYANAVNRHLETFAFDGNAYVVGYAKYLIEYLEGRFAK